jgi:hypothetical protein
MKMGTTKDLKLDQSMIMYMNVETGSVDDYEGWQYTNEDGGQVNAVDREEVIPVYWNHTLDQYVSVPE